MKNDLTVSDQSTFAYESFMHYLRRRNIMKFKLIIEEKDSSP